MRKTQTTKKQWLEIFLTLPVIVLASALLNSNPAVLMIVFLLIGFAYLGYKTAGWILKDRKKDIFLNFLSWANTVAWIVPIIGLFVATFTLRGFYLKGKENWRYGILSVFGLCASISNSLLGTVIGYAKGTGTSLDFIPTLAIGLTTVTILIFPVILFSIGFKFSKKTNNVIIEAEGKGKEPRSDNNKYTLDDVLKIVLIIAILIGVSVIAYRYGYYLPKADRGIQEQERREREDILIREKEEQEKIEAKEDQDSIRLSDCLEYAEYSYSLLWDRNCSELGYGDDCRLPNLTADGIEDYRKELKDDCFSRY